MATPKVIAITAIIAILWVREERGRERRSEERERGQREKEQKRRATKKYYSMSIIKNKENVYNCLLVQVNK